METSLPSSGTEVCRVCKHHLADTTPYLCRKCAPSHRDYDPVRWPESLMGDEHVSDEWVVVSNGPSSHALAPSDLPDLPRVAVNHVVSHPEIEFDYWCVWETRGDLWTHLHALPAAPTRTTWIPALHESHWKERVNHSRAQNGSPRLSYEVLPYNMPSLARWATPPWEGPVAGIWQKRTFFMALLGAIRKGARRITVFGAEMDGDVNFGGGPTSDFLREDYAKRHRLAWEGRWMRERELYAQIEEECREHGIEIHRERAV